MEKSDIFDPKAQTHFIDKVLFQKRKSNYTGETMPEGMDYQGIQWKTEMRHTTRETFQMLRHAAYKPFREFKERSFTTYPLKRTVEGEPYYEFEKFYKIPDLWRGHFQLKHNLVAPTSTDLLFPCLTGFSHYSLSNFSEKRFSLQAELNPVSMDFKNDIVALSAVHGNLTLYDLPKEKVLVSKDISVNGTLNNTVSFLDHKGKTNMKLYCGGNDSRLQLFDLRNDLRLISQTIMDKPVNFIKASPDGNLLLVLSDKEEVELVDVRSNEVITELYGHEDYGFSGDWHPSGNYLATGNQDSTCRIWDLRKTNREIKTLMAQIGNSSIVKYSPAGTYLAVGENIDFVEVYNVDQDYEDMQIIDFFGEVVGLDFDAEYGDSLFIGVMLNNHNGIFEYNIKKQEHISALTNYMF